MGESDSQEFMAEFVGLASLGVLTTVSQAREELRPERRVDKV